MLAAVGACLLLGATIPAYGTATPVLSVAPSTWEEQGKIVPADADAPGYLGFPSHSFVFFGSSVAIDGQTMVVGTSPDSFDHTSWAYVFEQENNGGWHQVQKLVPQDSEPWGFGMALAVDDEEGIIVVGDPGYNKTSEDSASRRNDGAAYVFERTPDGAWVQTAQLLGNDDGSGWYGPMFGRSVTVDGPTLAVAAPLEDPEGMEDAGAVYVYQRTSAGWERQARLLSPEAQEHTLFGGFRGGIALSGDTLLAGAPEANLPGDDYGVGKAYLFERSSNGTWLDTGTLVPPNPGGRDGPGSDAFGFSVALEGSTAVVGDPGWDSIVGHADRSNLLAHTSGRAYVFADRGEQGWSLTATLAPHDSAPRDWFAWSLGGISQGTIAIAADMKPGLPVAELSHSGAVYIFERLPTGWTETAKLQAAETSPDDNLGWGLGISGGTVAAGAPFDDNRRDGSSWPADDMGTYPPEVGTIDGKDAGSVYVFERPPMHAGLSMDSVVR